VEGTADGEGGSLGVGVGGERCGALGGWTVNRTENANGW